MKTILIIGLGDLGRVTLELLARDTLVEKIVVGSRNHVNGKQLCNLARLGGLVHDCSPIIEFTKIDLNLVDQTGDIIQQINPDIILCTASLMPWWFPNLFPLDLGKNLRKMPFGAWLPLHLTLPIKLMQALRQIDFHNHVIMVPFPDVVNQILGTQGLAPTIGAGNLDEIVPKIRLLTAQKLDVSPLTVEVTLVAHHSLEAAVFGHSIKEMPPYYLKIRQEGVDVTEQVKANQLLITNYPIPGGPEWHFLTGSSIVRLIKAFLKPQKQRLHAPGPLGLPGGYPVLVNENGVEIAPLHGLSLDNAVQINEQSHPFDGIEKVDPDGSVLFTDSVAAALAKTFGYKCEKLWPTDVESSAEELKQRILAYAQENSVKLPY